MTTLAEIEGIGVKYATKLKAAGVPTAEALLEQGATPAGRKKIADASGISDKLILEWINHMDLFRIKGVASEYADLLEEAGVDTIPELATRKADHLFAKLEEVNKAKKLVRQLPTLEKVQDWIDQAKKLPRKISY